MRHFLLIDDHEVVRTGIGHVLEELFRPCTIHEAKDEATALAKLKEQSFDLIIMDVYMPGTDTFGIMEFIKVRLPEAKVLIFSMSAENIYAPRLIRAGAKGFLSKNTGIQELKKAVETLLAGKMYISTELALQLASGLQQEEPANPFDKLSSKEFEIASLMMEGKSLTEISSILGTSTSTVGTHKARLFKKLNCNNLLELVELGKAYQATKRN